MMTEYERHLSNAAMYRREAERKLDRRYHPACAAGELAYARWHENKAAEILSVMVTKELHSEKDNTKLQ